MKIEELIGANVVRRREALEMSQAQLGEALGQHLGNAWSRQAVSSAEKGRRAFSAADLLALARALDTSIPSLFLPRSWNQQGVVTLAEGVDVPTDEYRDRILHDSDNDASFKFITQANVEELAEAVVTLNRAYALVGDRLSGLSDGVKPLFKVLGILAEVEKAKQGAAALEESDG
ncbi:helix-turn-helix domain-containing protein [Actinacidiphila sp. DG2A-62]|uniref:helix-turn-helix transcriptional regulator n=1 Tax=Actinacidiphila sp. DG2A-62 TaxID=3108821 RepID=UPI002DB5AA54|nr:helix-turn-helix domain-containing protein [Actinacidiphila sp. DG2A-62]MEC3992251.1 helix-turn-helix domain-containing protein [Actinacidiphila sp. DG2A-62]